MSSQPSSVLTRERALQVIAATLRSTTFRIGLLNAGLFALSVSLLFAVVYVIMARSLAHQFDEDIEDDLTTLVETTAAHGPAALRDTVARLAASDSGAYYLLLDPSGRRVAGNAPDLPAAAGWAEAPLVANSHDPEDQEHILRAIMQRLPDGSFLAIGGDLYSIGQVRERIVSGFVVCLVATILLALGSSVLSSLVVLRRIEGVREASRDIMAGDLDRRIPIGHRSDEFAALAAQLNAMLDRIQMLMEDLRQVSNDLAHDLRSPLARLRRRLERARERVGSDPVLDEAIEETDGIVRLSTAILRLAQIEAGTRRAGFRQLNLSELLEVIVETFEPVAEDRGQRITAVIRPGIQMEGDPELLGQLFANLVENALTHGPPGITVELRLRREPSGAIAAAVVDNGPGIPAGLRGQVLKRFARLDSSRSTPGSGLGLSIAAAIVALHGGRLQLDDNQPGLQATVRFPY